MRKIEVEKATPERLRELGVERWSDWSCAPETFDWEYDADERAYVKEGRVTVRTADQAVDVGAGDIVLFPKGTKCTWTVHETIRKVYRFE